MNVLGFRNLRHLTRQLGQGMTEFIVIVMVVAVGSIFVYTQFGDVLRNQVAVAAKTLAGQDGGVQTAAAQEAADAAATGARRNLANAAGSGGGGYGGGGSGGGASGTSGSDGGTSGGEDGASGGDFDEIPPSGAGGGGAGDLTQQNAAANVVGSDPTNADKYPAVQALIARSPTLQAAINRLKAEEWRFEFTTGFSEVMKDDKIVYIQNSGDEYGTVQRIAHEVGHVESTVLIDYTTRENYVWSRLNDEGAAVMYNIKVQQEILQSPGGQYKDIGVNCGTPPCHAQYGQPGRYDHIYAQYLADGDFEVATWHIGELRKDEPSGNNNETYQQYYERGWNDYVLKWSFPQSQNPGTP